MQFLYKDKNGNVTETYVGQVIQVSSLPTASSSNVDFIYQYTGATTNDYTHGYFYQCTEDSSTTPSTYSWVQLNVQPGGSGGQTIQVDTMPTASVSELGKIYQFVGITGTYVNGYFYKCVSDGAVSPTYSWVAVKMPADGEWRGTSAEYELVKDNLPNDTVIIITDRTASSAAVYPGAKIDVLLSNQIVEGTSTYARCTLSAPIYDYDLLILVARSDVQGSIQNALSVVIPPSLLDKMIRVPLVDSSESGSDYGLEFYRPEQYYPKTIRIKQISVHTYGKFSYADIYGIKF